MEPTRRLTLQDRWAIYETSVVLAWADGRLGAEEVQAARVVAEELSLHGPFSLAGTKLRLAQADIPDVSESIADLVFASAVWMAHANGRLHRRESILLARLQRRLGIEDDDAKKTIRRVRRLGDNFSRRTSFQRLLRRRTLEFPPTPQRPLQ